MIKLRKSADRSRTRLDWLDSHHTFSFGEHYDPEHVNFGALRVINEDRVAPGAGFPLHAHRDMEIVSYVLDGGLEHKDSLGTGAVIRPGEMQRMSAGTGIRHSEFNASTSAPVHFLQIWILPERPGLAPAYEQRAFAFAPAGWTVIGARDGREGAVTIHQDVDLYAAKPKDGEEIRFKPRPGRKLWLQMARGKGMLNGLALAAGDGAAIEGETELRLAAGQDLEALLFDLAA